MAMESKLEFWRVSNGFPGKTQADAEGFERDGWDGMGVPDSQNLTGDPYVALALAAKVTDKLLLRPSVTNPFTRHPAVTATSIMTVQVESNGRAVLGIGRGDSALAHIGLSPAPVKIFREYMERVQGYLRGEAVPFRIEEDGGGEIASVDALQMGGQPTASELRWARHVDVPKVPLDGVASGPRVIASIAPIAERLSFAVGASDERVGWAIDVARKARTDAGLDPDDIEFGVMLQVSPHPDREVAVKSIAGTIASTARFSVMQGKPLGPMSDSVRDTLLEIHRVYDMNKHSRVGQHTAALTDEVIDTFTIVGSAERCVERLLGLRALGVTKFCILAADWRGIDPKLQEHSRRTLAEEVLPAVREGARQYERESAAAGHVGEALS